jgi:hypothetical protein
MVSNNPNPKHFAVVLLFFALAFSCVCVQKIVEILAKGH